MMHRLSFHLDHDQQAKLKVHAVLSLIKSSAGEKTAAAVCMGFEHATSGDEVMLGPAREDRKKESER